MELIDYHERLWTSNFTTPVDYILPVILCLLFCMFLHFSRYFFLFLLPSLECFMCPVPVFTFPHAMKDGQAFLRSLYFLTQKVANLHLLQVQYKHPTEVAGHCLSYLTSHDTTIHRWFHSFCTSVIIFPPSCHTRLEETKKLYTYMMEELFIFLQSPHDRSPWSLSLWLTPKAHASGKEELYRIRGSLRRGQGKQTAQRKTGTFQPAITKTKQTINNNYLMLLSSRLHSHTYPQTLSSHTVT